MNNQQLWKDRFQIYFKEMSKYLKYIFNGHLLIVLVFLIGGAGYYYSKWVGTLTSNFPTAWIMGIVLGVFLTSAPISTFFKEADMIFLLPIETKLKPYIQRSFVVSLIVQVYVLAMVLAIFMPLYKQTITSPGYSFITLLVVTGIIKAINMIVRWYALYYREKSAWFFDGIIRFLLNATLMYLLIEGAHFIFLILIGLLLISVGLFNARNAKEIGLNWEKLIELENGRMASFYRVANLFTDVPKLKDKVSERKWLSRLLKIISIKQENTFVYLYWRTFLRANDYFGLFVRLTIIAGVICLFADLGWGLVFISLLFLYLTGLQLLPIWHHHDYKLWVDLYPLAVEKRKKAVIQLLTNILVIQNIIFFICIFIGAGFQSAVVTLLLGFVLIFLLRPYATSKLTTL